MGGECITINEQPHNQDVQWRLCDCAGNADTKDMPYPIGGDSPYAVTGVAFGPDEHLYVGMRSFDDPLFGAILRFDVSEPPGVRRPACSNTFHD